MRGTPGQPYRPSNGTEGMSFQAHFCDVCLHDAKYRATQDGRDGCKVLCYALCFKEDDPKYPPEWTYDWNGQPTCTRFLDEGEDRPFGPPIPDGPGQRRFCFVTRKVREAVLA